MSKRGQGGDNTQAQFRDPSTRFSVLGVVNNRRTAVVKVVSSLSTPHRESEELYQRRGHGHCKNIVLRIGSHYITCQERKVTEEADTSEGCC